MNMTRGSGEWEDCGKETDQRTPCVPHRYKLAIFAAMGLVLVVGSRSCFSLVMTHVTSGANVSLAAEDVIFTDCTAINTSLDMNIDMGGDTMFLLHASYSAGLTVGKFPGSLLSTLFSPKRVISLSVLMTSVLTMVLPLAIPFSSPLLFLLRTTQGLVEALQQPATVGILSAWSTSTDNARLTSIFMTGCVTAPVIASLLTGAALCYVSWSVIFYVCGTCGVTWCVIWLMNFYDTPDLHPSLSEAEHEHHRKHGCSVRNSSKQLLRSIPWRKILTCPSVWAVFVGSFSRNLVFSLMVFEQPQYFRDAFKLKTADIGIVSTLPYVGLSVTCTMGGVVSDRLLRCGLGKTCTRKLAYTLGHGVEALSLMGLYFTSDWRTAIFLFCIGIACGGFAYSGYLPLASDAAPQYAGVIAGLAMMGTIGAVFSTLLASFLTGVTRTLQDWQQLFLITGLVHVADIIIFDVIANAELQPWAGGIPENRAEGSVVAQASDSVEGYEETSLLAEEEPSATPSSRYGAMECRQGKPGVLRIEER